MVLKKLVSKLTCFLLAVGVSPMHAFNSSVYADSEKEKNVVVLNEAQNDDAGSNVAVLHEAQHDDEDVVELHKVSDDEEENVVELHKVSDDEEDVVELHVELHKASDVEEVVVTLHKEQN